jgi:glycosyltransferase involved in cell wall biosynthesis
VITAFERRLPVRRLYEATPGLSNARNAAIGEAKGEYLIWTDDDVLVSEVWLQEYLRAFSQWPEASVFGGRIDPWFIGSPPAWLPRVFSQVRNAFATLDLGEEPQPLSRNRFPFGANMAFRTADQVRFPYQAALGRRAGNLLGGEEVDVVQRMLDAGLTGRWVPTAQVRHSIPPERQTTKYLRGYFFAQGQLRPPQTRASVAQFLGRPRWLWRRALEAELTYRIRRLGSPPETWIGSLIEASVLWGQLRGLTDAAPRREGFGLA